MYSSSLGVGAKRTACLALSPIPPATDIEKRLLAFGFQWPSQDLLRPFPQAIRDSTRPLRPALSPAKGGQVSACHSSLSQRSTNFTEQNVAQTVPSARFEPTAESERFVRPLAWILGFRMQSRCGRRTFRNPAPKARACFLLNRPTRDNAYMFRHGYTSSRTACPAAGWIGPP